MATNTVTNDVRWLAPVYVRFDYGLAEAVRSPRDALTCLHFHWPTRRGRAFDTARTLCAVAMLYHLAGEDAREAFLRACIEAGILD